MLDKDGLAARLPPPDGTGFALCPPDRKRFLQTIYDFWFEAYCITKYLSRRDLWFAKLLENHYIKDHLFQMAFWHHQAANDWQPDPMLHTRGKRFEKWASAELIEALSHCFSLYDIDETWKSLFATAEVFKHLK